MAYRLRMSDSSDVKVRPLVEADLPEADRVMRLAFGTFLKLPDPMAFLGDGDFVFSRFKADPTSAFAAEINGKLVGSSFATRWGSVGFFGPLTVHPENWDKKIAQALLVPTLACFETWGITHAGLYTFASSAKHIGLYQKFGFWPQYLNAMLWKKIRKPKEAKRFSTFGSVPDAERDRTLAECHDITNAMYRGLDLAHEIRAVQSQSLGDTLLVRDEAGIAAFAVCHAGPRTEAGSGALYAKFAAARPGPNVARDFEALLDACEAYASERGLLRFVAGVSTARHEAYRAMLARGYRIETAGLTMMRGNEPGYRRPGIYALDDWR